MQHIVIVNNEGHYLIWSDQQNTPDGWRSSGISGTKDECLAAINDLIAIREWPQEPAHEQPKRAFVAPRTPTEALLAAVCMDILQLERVSIHDNFFDLGARSLQIALARRKLQALIGREVPLVKLFEHPTLGALAAYIDGAEQSSQSPERPHANEQLDAGKQRLKQRLQQRKLTNERGA